MSDAWALYDEPETPQAAEREVQELLAALVRATKAAVIVELGTHLGATAEALARAAARNGAGRVFTVEIDAGRCRQARERLAGLPAVVVEGDSRLLDPAGFGPIDLLFCDGGGQNRPGEYGRWGQAVRPGGLIVLHDTAKPDVPAVAVDVPHIVLSTPRGLTICQRPGGAP